MVTRDVPRDREQPRQDRSAPVVLRLPSRQLKEGQLHEVFDLLPMHEAPEVARHATMKALEELPHRRGIARPTHARGLRRRGPPRSLPRPARFTNPISFIANTDLDWRQFCAHGQANGLRTHSVNITETQAIDKLLERVRDER